MSEEPVILNKYCPECGCDRWYVSDGKECYHEICSNCYFINEIKKQDFIDNFQCLDCNCLEGTLEENKNLIAVRCKHCGKQVIVLEKHTTNYWKTEVLENQQESNKSDNTPKCPKCGSTSIQIVPRKWTLLGGFATKKTDRVCVNCKYKW